MDMKNYLENRGFNEDIQKEFGLEPRDKNIFISYYDINGELLYKRTNWPNKDDPRHKGQKYISPPTDRLPEGHQVLFNLNKLGHITDTLLIIEGEYNCISAWYMGYYGLGAPGQTTRLQEHHLKPIPDTIKKIIVLYDDLKFATERAKEILRYFDYDKEVYIAKYPEEYRKDGKKKDANDYFREGLTIDFKAIMNVADRYMADQLTSPGIKVKIPDNDFIAAYKKYTSEISDAPGKYQELMALSIISTVLSRQVYMPWFNDSKLYPNLYIVLIGKSTIMRKSESISSAIKMIRIVNDERIFPSQFTQEAFFGLLQDKPVGVISWPEFGGFLAGASKSYMAGTKSFLTELYDCPDIIEKKLVSEGYRIEDPCINIITGTTIQYFKDWLNDSDTFGGFYGRFIYMPCEPKDKNGYFPNPLEEQPTGKKNKLLNHINTISKIEGSFKQSEEAKVLLTRWLILNNKEVENFDDEDRRASFYGRYDAYLRKFAMLYEISESGTLVISKTAALRAIKMMNILKEALAQLIREHFAFTKEEKDIQKIFNIIKTAGNIRRDKLLQNSHMTSKQLNEVLSTLIQSNVIASYTIGEGNKPAREYKAI